MSTHDDRLAALEQKVADIELERLYEKRTAAQATPSEQAYDAKQVNHRLTMLLGIVSGQEKEIRETKERLISIDDRLIDANQRMESHFETLEKQLKRVEQGIEQRFEQVLQQLASLAAKLDQGK